jgi:hypothetical protein
MQNAGQTHELAISFPSAQVAQFTSYHGSGSNLTFRTTPNAGSPTERMRIDSSGNVGIGTTTPTAPLQVNGTITATSVNTNNTFGFKNRIINGAMVIDQRNAGASTTPTASGIYNLDRWKTILTQSSKFSIQQNAGSVTPPVGFINYAGITSLSAYSVVSSDIFSFAQAVEGLNVTDLGWGTANAKTVTVSFWVRSSLTGTFSVTLSNASQARSYPATYTISAANTWEYKTITVAGDTSGTWLTTNGIGVWLFFNLGSGSTFSATANAWGAGEIYAATGATSVVGTNGATFYITGVQLEVGSTATSFDYRPYGTELQLCQRYYERWINTAQSFALQTAQLYNGTTIYGRLFYMVEKRAAPTITFSATGNTLLECYATGAGALTTYTGSPAAGVINTKSFEWSHDVTGVSGGTAILAGIRVNQSFQISAEL